MDTATDPRAVSSRLTTDDLQKIVTIDDAQISPDGACVAYAVKRAIPEDNRYASAIYLASVDGEDAPRKITDGARRDSAPRWSPDGQQLAFVSDRSGVGQVYLLDLRGGEAQQLSRIPRGVSNPVWSPDGTRLAVLSSEGEGIDDAVRARPGGFIRRITRLQYRFNEQDYIDDRFNQVWIINAATGDATRVTSGTASIQYVAWSPDGQTLAYTTNRLNESNAVFESQLYIAPADGSGEERMLSAGSDDALGPAWSPDGSSIAFIGGYLNKRAGGNLDIFLATPAGDPLVCLTTAFDRSPNTSSFSDTWGPREHTPLRWAPDGSGVHFTASDHGNVGVYRAAADGSGVTHVVGGAYTIGNVSLSRDGERMAFIAADFTNPCDIYVCNSDGSDRRRLTHLNAAVLADRVQTPEHMPFESFDGRFQVDAWLLRPVGYDASKQYPLVHIIHGGPHSIFGATFFFDMQLWANHGWNVLFINPRASQGYGEEFAVANIGDWGGADWKEQEQALELAIARGGVDPNRLAVTGLSYGGFMTNWIVGQTNRYKVAISENGICNLVSFFTTSDIGWYWLEKEMEKPVWENLAWYMEHSPLAYVQNMSTPMLLLQAESDYRCPIEQGEQLYTALRARDIPAEMVRFPGESHGQLSIGKPETRRVRREVTLEWLQRYLG